MINDANINRTVFFGVMSVNNVDLLYPCHSQQDVDRAKRKAAMHTSVDDGNLRVICYFERKLPTLLAADINMTAVGVALGRLTGIDSPRYQAVGPQEA